VRTCLGCSLSGAVAQELALAHPDRVGALVLYGTWGRLDAYMRASFTALRQWQADEEHDTLDRLAGIGAPTLVIAGEQDLLTPPLALAGGRRADSWRAL
jgi:pimeloyl-ACP methyl ester carboxylesterase